MSGATLEQKNGVLELTKLEYHKKWYIPIYFSNSVSGPNISKINANGPFWPSSYIKIGPILSPKTEKNRTHFVIFAPKQQPNDPKS